MIRGLVVAVAACACVMTVFEAAPAQRNGQDVAVMVVPPFDPAAYASRGAVGLVVPGWGETVTREAALTSLRTGKVASALVGGIPSAKPLIELADRPGRETTILVSLPPAGEHQNDRRYPVAVVGGGYRGLLTSSSTRIPGLVAIADIAPAAVALERGETPRLGSELHDDPVARLASIDERLDVAREARLPVTVLLVSWLPVLAFFAFVLRSGVLARAAVLVPCVALLLSLLLSAVDLRSGRAVIVLESTLVGPAAILLSLRRAWLPAVVAATLGTYLVVLVGFTDIASLAALGPQPSGGARFYGTTNKIETLLLAPTLAAAAVLPRRLSIALGVLALITVGWSRAGADGGGVIVLGVSLIVLGLLLHGTRITPRLAGATVGCVLLGGAAAVLLDAATGGDSHVTTALTDRQNAFGEIFADRLRLSWEGMIHSSDALSTSILGALTLALVALLGRRRPAVVALLAGLATSMLVNDTGADVLLYGMVGGLAVLAWTWIERPPGRTTLAAVPSSSPGEHDAG